MPLLMGPTPGFRSRNPGMCPATISSRMLDPQFCEALLRNMAHQSHNFALSCQQSSLRKLERFTAPFFKPTNVEKSKSINRLWPVIRLAIDQSFQDQHAALPPSLTFTALPGAAPRTTVDCFSFSWRPSSFRTHAVRTRYGSFEFMVIPF
eukprot:IDg18665t1